MCFAAAVVAGKNVYIYNISEILARGRDRRSIEHGGEVSKECIGCKRLYQP